MIRIAILDDEKADLEKEEQIARCLSDIQDSIFITDRQNLRLQHIRAWNGFCWASPKNSLISTFWMQRCQ